MMIKTEQVTPVISGTFDAKRFFETLALIISNREGVAISVTVTKEEKPLQKKSC